MQNEQIQDLFFPIKNKFVFFCILLEPIPYCITMGSLLRETVLKCDAM